MQHVFLFVFKENLPDFDIVFRCLHLSFLGTGGKSFSKVNTMPITRSNAEISESTSSQFKLERSKTEQQRRHSILAEEAAQIFDQKIPAQQKVCHVCDV